MAMSGGDRRAEALAAGRDDFIAKPFDFDGLCDVVGARMRRTTG